MIEKWGDTPIGSNPLEVTTSEKIAELTTHECKRDCVATATRVDYLRFWGAHGTYIHLVSAGPFTVKFRAVHFDGTLSDILCSLNRKEFERSFKVKAK